MVNKDKHLTVVLGDLAGSRNAIERKRLRNKIEKAIRSANQVFEKELKAPLNFAKGIDELSAVLNKPRSSYQMCRFVNDEIYPHLFRFAIARNMVDVAPNSEDARIMDGPAFHTAANLMNYAKKENRYYCFNLGPAFDQQMQWLNELANLIQLIRNGWTTHQRLIVRSYEKLRKQKMVARKFGISQQAISDALRQAHWDDLKCAEDIINGNLAKWST